MSHVVTVDVEVKSLEALKKMCANLGWQLKEGQKTYAWYGRWVGDYQAEDSAIKQGFKEEDLGTCDHAITIPDCKYEVGLKFLENKYVVVWDFWEKDLKVAMGGQKAERFCQEYGLAAVQVEAESQGYNYTTKKLDNGSYEIEVETF